MKDKNADSQFICVNLEVYQSSAEAGGVREAESSKGSNEFVVPTDSWYVARMGQGSNYY